MCSEMSHLSKEQFTEAKEIFENYQEVFTVSNTKIGRTNCMNFHINTDHMSPISTPLHRVPLHQQEIVKELLDHYHKLGLIEPINYLFRAATVPIQNKNVAASSQVADKYRLCTDYHFLNNVLPDSGLPAPFAITVLRCCPWLCSLSAINFSSGDHQIPCTDRAKHTIAFSPGYGFGQWTWNVMPQGIKPVSHTFQ